MADTTEISWTDATFNPWIGCSRVHTGCERCYAESFAKRYGKATWGPNGTRVKTSEANWRKPLKWNREAEKAGVRRKVFCSSLADVFEDWTGPIHDHQGRQLRICVDDGEIVADSGAYTNVRSLTMNDLRRMLFRLIDATPWLDWQLLTKRPENIRRMWAAPLPSGDYQAITREEILPIPGADGYFASNYGVIYTSNGSQTCLRCGKQLDGMARKKYCGSACRQAMWKAGTTTVDRNNMRPLSPDEGDDGHQRVTLFVDGQRERELVHRLILSVFVRDPEPGEQGCHRDRNPRNNRLDNIRWGTQSSNWDDSKQHGTQRRYSKLTLADVEAIRASSDTAAALGERFGVSGTQIRNIQLEKQWIAPSLFRPNVFLGTSVSDQATADTMIPRLLKCRGLTPVLFLSMEPLLGPVILPDVPGCDPLCIEQDRGGGWRMETRYGLPNEIHWVIVGGESGHGARPMHPDWARDIRNQCQAAGVSFFFKQWGTWEPLAEFSGIVAHSGKGKTLESLTVDGKTMMFQNVGKEAAGDLLDGIEWKQFPQTEPAHA